MANPMKIAKLISKQVKKRDAVRTAVRKKSYSAAPAKAKFLTPTTGKVKATKRNAGVKEFMDPITKGKNKNFVKDANKKTLPGASKSSRASVKEANFNSRMEKHPLVRNTGQSSAEGKYRANRGKPIPVKRRSK
jgi:hypothetical protein